MARKHKSIIVVDLEATCWNTPTTKQNEIIEIGVQEIDIKSCTPTRNSSIIVLPTTTEISPFCTQLTTLTPEFVAENGISFTDAIHKLRTEFRTEDNIWASYGDYDRKQVERQCIREKIKYPFGNMHINVKALFASVYGFSTGLDGACKEMGIEMEGTHHRGHDDARNIAKVLVNLLPEFIYETSDN